MKRKRCQRVAPSMRPASSSWAGRFCSAARNISMNVPEVVQTTSEMIAHIATLGPEVQSHQVRPSMPCPVSAAGGAVVSTSPTASRARCRTPRGSANHCGPLMPNRPRMALIAPLLANMNRKTTLMATELVTDGK
jgi:hypothetical protein